MTDPVIRLDPNTLEALQLIAGGLGDVTEALADVREVLKGIEQSLDNIDATLEDR